MQKVLTAAEMGEVDRLTTEKYSIPSILLMENAAHAAVRVITEKLGGGVFGKSFLVVCGKGNNGGDGAALGRILWMLGAIVEVYLFGSVDKTKGDARVNFEAVGNLGLSEDSKAEGLYFEEVDSIDNWIDTTGSRIGDFDVLIDSLFGTGLTKALDSSYERLTRICSAGDNNPLVVSIDLPSGLETDSALPVGENIRADMTVTFTAPKLSNVYPPASNFNGELHIANIGSPAELVLNAPSSIFVSGREDAQVWLEKTIPESDTYKKNRGIAFLVVGSKNYSGAAVLAADACFSAGAGIVFVGVPESLREITGTKVLSEIIPRGFAETDNGAFDKSGARDVLELSGKTNVLALGCGLSAVEQSTKEFVRQIVVNRQTPIVLDADGLNALSPFELKGSDDQPLVLTPHPGEFARLLGRELEIGDEIGTARAFAEKHQLILVLKGEKSLIAAPDGRVVINPTGNAGISRAGAGDTLTGIITGFLAQTYAREKPTIENTFETVVAALYIAGIAGDLAAEKFGQRLMMATDVRECLSKSMDKLSKND